MAAELIPARSLNSPAWTGAGSPSTRAKPRKMVELPRMAFASSSCRATLATLEPCSTTMVVGCEVGPGPAQNSQTIVPAAMISSAGTIRRRTRPRFIRGNALSETASASREPSSDGFHHQAGIGPAEAEAVVEHRLHLALLGLVR